MNAITMTGKESEAWRPQISGWSFDILPFYEMLSRQCGHYARIVEIGTAGGRSAIFLAEAFRKQNKGGVEFYTVDHWDAGWVEGARSLITNARPDELDLIRFMRLTSAKASRIFDDDYFDVAFIDADHSFDSIKDDIRMWLPKVKPGGMICGHDYHPHYDGVIKAVEEARVRHAWTDFEVLDTVWTARRKFA